MQKIQKIYIENVKSIKKSEVSFSDLTVITGVNSSGKSTLIQSILYLSQFFASSEFISNDDEFYVPSLPIYDRYLVNKNRSYAGLKNNYDMPIKLGFKNQNQELLITFSNSTHSGLRINPENMTLKNKGMNRSIELNRFPKLPTYSEMMGTQVEDIQVNHFLEKYFLGNLYFDLIGNTILDDIKIIDRDLEPFSLSSTFNYDLEDILENRNENNEVLKKFLKTNNQFNFSQSTNLNNGILKQKDRNFGDSYSVTNLKAYNLFSSRYKQNINSSNLVLKESNFFLQYFLSKLPRELTSETNFGSGIREQSDFEDYSDSLIQQWLKASKRIAFQNLLKDTSENDLPDVVSNIKNIRSNVADVENLFYTFQLFVNKILRRDSMTDPLNIPEYINDFISEIARTKLKGNADNISRRRIFDAIDELEYIVATINKELLEQGNILTVDRDKLNYGDVVIPQWNKAEKENIEKAREDIESGDKPFISVVKRRDGRFDVIDGLSACLAYEKLGIKTLKVNLINDNDSCICNNKSWEANDREVDQFLKQSKIENTKTYLCPVDNKLIHVGYFSRGEATESAEAQKYGTFFLYPQKGRGNNLTYSDPIDFLFDLLVFIDKNPKNKEIIKDYFSFLFADKVTDILDEEISNIKNYINDIEDTTSRGKSEKSQTSSNIPDYGDEYKSSRKKQSTEDYYDTNQLDKSVFDINTYEEAKQTLNLLRKLKRDIKKQGGSVIGMTRKFDDFIDTKVVLYEKSDIHGGLEDVYPNPFSEKNNFLNDMNYLSTIRDPDNQNDPVGNYANILPIGQNAGGLAEYLTLYGDREVEPFISPKWNEGEPLRNYEELAWVKSEPQTLYEAIRHWLQYLGLKDYDFQVINEGTQRSIKFKGGASPTPYGREITEIGSGIGKILPVIVNCLIAKPGQVVLIEEPETHLHPGAQTYLADFLFAMSFSRQIIIETHSPTIIDRLRFRSIHKSANELKIEEKPEIQIIFSELENNETLFRHGTIDELGDIVFEDTEDSRPWPAGFFDNTDRDLTNILRARKEKLDKNLEE